MQIRGKGQNRIDRLHIASVFFILLSLSMFFVHFTLRDLPNSFEREGIYVNAFILWGGKSTFFLFLLFVSVILSFWHQKKSICIIQLSFLLSLILFIFYWTGEVKVVLENSSTNEVWIQVSFGFISTVIVLLFLIIRLVNHVRKL